MLQYELASQRLDVAKQLIQHAPRPILIKSDSQEQSPLTTLLLAQLLPSIVGRGKEKE
jgi:hypothetical protein